ncbi:MAG: chemotaxis protein CheW [Coriobacteriia bacterium]|nr:chemotaxis protein CheW [Coriobacteriia bacterium]
MSEVSGAGYVIFRLGEEEYGLPVTSVSGIIRYEEATPVPRSPVAVLGVVNLRGRVIPVVDLRMRFRGVAFEPGPTSRIVVTEGAAGPVGIAVDAASEVASIDGSLVRPVPEGVLAPETARAFSGVVERGGALTILLDLDHAVPRSEYAGAVALEDEKIGEADA